MVYAVSNPLRTVGLLHSTRTDVESIAVTELSVGGVEAVGLYNIYIIAT